MFINYCLLTALPCQIMFITSLEPSAVVPPPPPPTASESDRLIQELEENNKALLRKIEQLEKSESLWKPAFAATTTCTQRHINLLFALPNLIATSLWLLMLLYFVIWYLGLPRDDAGRSPQICESFSLWPYISCIGAMRLSFFRGVCVTMALLISTSFLLLCYLSAQISSAIWLRRLAAFFAIVSSSALIALSFEPIDSAPTTHLVSTSIQIFAMGNTKFFDWISNSVIRRSFRGRIGAAYRIRPLEVSRWLKTTVAAFAAGKFCYR